MKKCSSFFPSLPCFPFVLELNWSFVAYNFALEYSWQWTLPPTWLLAALLTSDLFDWCLCTAWWSYTVPLAQHALRGETVLFTKGEQPCIVSDLLFLLFYYCHLKYRTMAVWLLLRVLEKQPFPLPVPWTGSVASSECLLPLLREMAQRCGVALVVVRRLGDRCSAFTMSSRVFWTSYINSARTFRVFLTRLGLY